MTSGRLSSCLPEKPTQLMAVDRTLVRQIVHISKQPDFQWERSYSWRDYNMEMAKLCWSRALTYG